ncbi:MAG TPA: dTDP-4-dehydrorhamnose reductase [Bacteroidota bacterium]|nr:dTDP-4-dehydrorhamnose reductase [Bacteroidota bacterium]
MKRILICGSNGLFGQRLALVLGHETEYEVLNTSHHRSFVLDSHLFDYTQLDITNKGDVKSLVTSFRPDIIVNGAAMTNVDACEEHRELAWKINVVGVENLVEVARKINSLLVHISTDYVFDGKNGPYEEGDRVNPINYYGKTKLAGENVILSGGISSAILRAIVVYGTGINVKTNFALWVVKSLREGKPIRCVDDQIANPTHVADLAALATKVIEQGHTGLYHAGGADTVSRYEFAVKAAEIFELDKSLIAKIRSKDLHQAAPRPMDTSLVTAKAEKELGFHPMTSGQGLLALKRELFHLTLN